MYKMPGKHYLFRSKKSHHMSIPESTVQPCFKNIISVRGKCSADYSTSGLMIDDAGISKTELSEYVTDSFSDWIDLFQKKLDFSILDVSQKVHSSLLPKYRANSIIENSRVGIFQNDLKMVSGESNKLKFIQFELLNFDSYVDLFISEIAFQVDYDGIIPISVFDLTENRLIETLELRARPNEVSYLYPNKKYKANRKNLNLMFAYDSTGINANTTYLTRNNSGCSDCAGGNRLMNQYMRIVPGKIGVNEPKINKNIKSTPDTGGMSIVYSLSCNHTDWLCSVSNSMALPILWNTAALIMEHALLIAPNEQMSPRLANPELLQKRYELFTNKFYQTFNDMLRDMRLPSDEKCFICNNRIRTTNIIPG